LTVISYELPYPGLDLDERTPLGISASTQNLLARLPAIASDRGNFRNSFSVPFRASFIFKELSWDVIV
jgi:hypothetical protein